MPDNAERLLKLATLAFPDLTPGEREVLRCAAVGQWADLAPWGPPLAEGQKREPGGGPLRMVVLQWLCADDARAKKLVHRKGVCIENATLDQPLDFKRADVPFFFGLHSCRLPGVNASCAKFGDTLYLKLCRIDGILDIGGAHIAGQLLCDGAQIKGTSDVAIRADGADIGNAVFLSDGFQAEGEVRLPGAKIKGQFNCKGGRFLNSNKKALNVDGANIDSDVLLSDDFRAEGEVRLAGIKISGDLVCRNGSFIITPTKPESEKNYSIYASCSTILGRVFLDGAFNAIGEVYFRSAEIHRHFDCTGGKFYAPGMCAFNAFSCTFKDSLVLLPQKVQGKIDLCRATIANDLTTTGATALRDCELDLSGARIGRLCDSKDSWPQPGKLHIDGLTYESIICDAPTRAKDRLEWLSLMPGKHFMPQPFEQLAAWYHRAGHDSFARDIRIAKERARLRQWLSLFSKNYWQELWARFRGREQNNPATCQRESLHKPWKLFLKEPLKRLWWWTKDITVGYGYKPHFALLWLLAMWLTGAIVFASSFPEGMTQSVSYKYSTRDQNLKDLTNSTEPLGLVLSTNYPAFNPYIYSLDVALPIVDLQQERYWMPNSETQKGRALWWFNWFEVLTGWFLASMGIAGATGIIRKD